MRIKAEFEFVQTPDGRRGPILNGYRPSFKLKNDKTQRNCDCSFTLLESDRINPGETQQVEVVLSTHGSEIYSDSIRLGTRFEVYEGARYVGEGNVLCIL